MNKAIKFCWAAGFFVIALSIAAPMLEAALKSLALILVIGIGVAVIAFGAYRVYRALRESGQVGP